MSKNLITVTQARTLVMDAVRPVEAERVEIGVARGRVLAQDMRASGDVPSFPSSAMDGYALAAGPAGRRLQVVGESRAGAPAHDSPGDREAIRISTGAAVPPGAEAVIPQENVVVDGSTIETAAAVSPGANIREPGGDMRAGTTVLTAGTRLGAAELGAAVAAGAGAVLVARRPCASVLCTGDELRDPGQPLEFGQIHNSNAPMLTALALGCGASTTPPERLPDDRAATEAGIAAALEHSDVVIISGGVSVGPHDHVKPVLAALGVEEVFWSVALQPGKPTWFGTLGGDKLVFGLPGNPVSAAVTFSLFAAPALAALQGAPPDRPVPAEARLGQEVRRNATREQAVRVRLDQVDGETVAHLTGPQGSHILTSLLGADALAMIPAGDGVLTAGTTVALEALAR